MSVIERAREDIAEGRLWKARDRLTGALGHRPHEVAVLDLLVDVYLAMGDVPAAGRFLMLSARDDGAARDARETFEWQQRASARDLATAVPAKQPLDRYPPVVQERLKALAKRASAEGVQVSWMRPRPVRGDVNNEGGWLGGALASLVGILLVLPWVVGLIYMIVMLARLL